MGAWIPGVIQGAQAKNAARDQRHANAELTRRMNQSQQAYEARRPEVAAQRMTALRNQLGLFNPANQMMGEMTGGRYSMDLSGLQSSPLTMKPNLPDVTRGDALPFQQWGDPEQAKAIEDWRSKGYDVSDLQKMAQRPSGNPDDAGRAAAARVRGKK